LPWDSCIYSYTLDVEDEASDKEEVLDKKKSKKDTSRQQKYLFSYTTISDYNRL
jgi:hypothetical protein